MADLGDSPTLNPAQGYGDAGFTNIPKILGFDQRWLPILQLLQQQRQAGYNSSAPTPDDTDINTFNNPNLPMWKRVGLQAPPPLTGPQQSYATASNLQGSGDGTSGQALRQTSNYNSTPYNPGPQGTIMNTGAPTQNSGEIVGQGTRGWNIYQTTPSWTGSPLSQAPPARDEGDFKTHQTGLGKLLGLMGISVPPVNGPPPQQQQEPQQQEQQQAPPISGPQNPLLQRQEQIRQAILQAALAKIPRGYQFKLG